MADGASAAGWVDALIFLNALGCGLMAGLFFVFSNSAMTALSRLEDGSGMNAMQAINAAIVNPTFLLLFFGTACLSAVSAAAALLHWQQPGSVWMLAGGLLYLAGGFGVTVICNVPLNNKLAAHRPDTAEGLDFWNQYSLVWTRWNHVRTFCSAAALGCFVLAAAG
ncbi:anthrone oxygenase family protein [Saccharibacillus kuerlensis]|nr:anthrone oxygenase family protein [Saccharibacillus kuerlensis]